MSRSAYDMPSPGEGFGLVTGDHWHFDITPWRNVIHKANQTERPRLTVLEDHLRTLEAERELLNTAIARAKRLRRAWRKP